MCRCDIGIWNMRPILCTRSIDSIRFDCIIEVSGFASFALPLSRSLFSFSFLFFFSLSISFEYWDISVPFCITVSYVWQYLYVGRMFFISWLIERDLYGLHVALDTIIYINPSSISIDPIMKNLHDFFVMGSSPNITTTITNSDRSELVDWLAGWTDITALVFFVCALLLVLGMWCNRKNFGRRLSAFASSPNTVSRFIRRNN